MNILGVNIFTHVVMYLFSNFFNAKYDVGIRNIFKSTLMWIYTGTSWEWQNEHFCTDKNMTAVVASSSGHLLNPSLVFPFFFAVFPFSSLNL